MATVFPLVAGGKAHFHDAGEPLQGGLVYFYLTGTSTLKTTYSESTGTTANANPVVLDSRGEADIYLLGDAAYKMVVQDSDGVTIYTRDPVYGLMDSGSISAALTAETSPAIGDEIVIQDVSEGAPNKMTLANMLKVVNALTAETSPATDDEVLLYDNSAGTADKVTLANLLKVVDGLTEDSTPDLTSDFLLSYDASATSVKKVKPTSILDPANFCQGRLTLTSGTAVTVSDVTGATTIYFTPFKGNKIAIYSGSGWTVYAFTEKSLTVPNTTNQMYDLFIYNNAGTLTLEETAWTNDTARATALTTQDGVLVKTGATTRRYLGSFRTTGVSGQTEDSFAKRYLWNYYHRVRRPMRVTDTTNSWNYSTFDYRQANAAATNQIDFVIGVSEFPVTAEVMAVVTNSTSTAKTVRVGIGLDGVTNSAQVHVPASVTDTMHGIPRAVYTAYVVAGRHYLTWLEKGAGADTQTWIGDNGGTDQSGIFGEMFG